VEIWVAGYTAGLERAAKEADGHAASRSRSSTVGLLIRSLIPKEPEK
jgi:hypothetical protein